MATPNLKSPRASTAKSSEQTRLVAYFKAYVNSTPNVAAIPTATIQAAQQQAKASAAAKQAKTMNTRSQKFGPSTMSKAGAQSSKNSSQQRQKQSPDPSDRKPQSQTPGKQAS